ncbi:hypothetical protein B0T25DRAFT_568704 [Lasiosphaeria hispida]|uniref:Uncharacterized protein n=1 Tax=Lasiosphaeria hispida TaxID=260671 RepID=A0AAJ0HJD5_9PEZI|nr:hypothetical protein B0T25DRAFT_568704 [Lasiosphaeria hispida]
MIEQAQIHTIAEWRDIKTGQYQNVVTKVRNLELNITSASMGFDLVVFYIQYYTYNVESVLSWRILFYQGAKSKEIPVQRACEKSLWHSTPGNMVLADFVMVLSFGVGCILLAILGKYIHTRTALVTWNVRCAQSGGDTETSASRSKGSPARPKLPQPPPENIYGRWLVLRFTVAFIALGPAPRLDEGSSPGAVRMQDFGKGEGNGPAWGGGRMMMSGRC